MSEFWDKGWSLRLESTDSKHFVNEKSIKLREIVKKSLNSLLSEKHHITDVMPCGDKTILNIGCGIGEAELFALMGAKNYIGIDYSFNAVKYSLENIRKLGGSGITALANAELLPIEDSSIDHIYSNGVLHHTPETQKTLDEVIRVLKPSGKGIIGLYNIWSPLFFIYGHILGSIRTVFSKHYKRWYEYGESAWKTKGCNNPWTKAYSLRELNKMFSQYDLLDLTFRKTGFSWKNTIPIFGKIIDKTQFGKQSSIYLQSKLGQMWVITFIKK